MSGLSARALLGSGLLLATLSFGSSARAEKPAPWRSSVMSHLTASREAYAAGPVRNWGISYSSVDETYAGPWANSPLSPTTNLTPTRAFVTVFEKNQPSSSTQSTTSTSESARTAESTLRRLGSVGLIASVLIPMVMASSGFGHIKRDDVSPHVGLAKLGRGYGVMLSGRFF
jgi:hypothetical protein